jgi:hypothetical protein
MESSALIIASAGKFTFPVSKLSQTSVHEASSKVKLICLLSGGGGSVLSHLEKNIKMKKRKTVKVLEIFILDS